MNSYQKRKAEIAVLEKQVEKLKEQLEAKANVFFMHRKWLGVGQQALGLVIDGKIENLNTYWDTEAKCNCFMGNIKPRG